MMKKIANTLITSLMPQFVKDKLFLWLTKSVSNHIKLTHGMTDHTTIINHLKNLGFKPSFIIDVGAYEGEWAKDTAKIFPESTILLIEPQTSKAQIINKVLSEYTINAEFKSALLGAKDDEKVNFYEMETGSSVFEEKTEYDRQVKEMTMTTLDSIMAEYNHGKSILLKLDVQGYELNILKGAEKTLENVSFLIIETSLLNYNENAPLIGNVFTYLNERNFVLFDICGILRKSSDLSLVQCDLVFTPANGEIRSKVDNFSGRPILI